jgi:glucose uptake protein GlcU
MSKWIGRGVGALVVAFVLFFVIKYPDQAAASLNTFFAAIRDAFWQVYDFFRGLGD